VGERTSAAKLNKVVLVGRAAPDPIRAANEVIMVALRHATQYTQHGGAISGVRGGGDRYPPNCCRVQPVPLWSQIARSSPRIGRSKTVM